VGVKQKPFGGMVLLRRHRVGGKMLAVLDRVAWAASVGKWGD
jgi:hypothetical protein